MREFRTQGSDVQLGMHGMASVHMVISWPVREDVDLNWVGLAFEM